MVKAIAIVLYESYTYALGQTYNTDRKRFLRIFDAYESMTIIITFSLYCICRYLMNPFLVLYTSGVNDIRYIDKWLPWLFAIFYLLHNGRTSSATVINIAQHFEDTKWRSIVESCINLSVSIVCVIHFGIYGVLFGTIAALLYRTNDMIIYAAGILHRSCWVTYKRWLVNLGVFFAVSFALDLFTIHAENYLTLLIYASGVSCFVIIAFIISNTILDHDNMIYVIRITKRTILSVIAQK